LVAPDTQRRDRPFFIDRHASQKPWHREAPSGDAEDRGRSTSRLGIMIR
jgi:hypothetical protein